ncbi:hypothetical protein CLU79DRAFT_749483 [Phycomyces nitens]|nr:hypothetical protein CLU79DRAFT_749483 [Phycomyces nitens]
MGPIRKNLPNSFSASRKETGLQTEIGFKPSTHEPEQIVRQPTDRQNFTISGVKIEFPFRPYKSQIQMMSMIVKALKNQDNALLESPTGSGKSLAILCAALAWLESEKRNESVIRAQKQREIAEIARKAWDEALMNNTAPPTGYIEIDNDEMDDDFQPANIRRKIGYVPPPPEPQVEIDDGKPASLDEALSDQNAQKRTRIYVGSRT